MVRMWSELDLHLSDGIGPTDYKLNDWALSLLEHFKVLRAEFVSLGGMRDLLIELDVVLVEHVQLAIIISDKFQ